MLKVFGDTFKAIILLEPLQKQSTVKKGSALRKKHQLNTHDGSWKQPLLTREYRTLSHVTEKGEMQRKTQDKIKH